MKRTLCLSLAAALVGGAAHAEGADLFSRETVSGLIDLRAAAADGEKSWVDGGYGKLRYGGAGDGIVGRAQLAEAHLIWQPRLSWRWSATLDATFQHDQDRAVDIGEAFLSYRSVPAATRYSARIGLIYPPVSLEHEGAAWTVADTITPSAINSWIGEEVKVIGAEGSVRRLLGDHEVAATGGVFGWNDTSGTLLSIRGWALHDLKATAFGDFPLPRMSAFLTPRQAPITKSIAEIDNRAGYYGRLEWRPPAAVSLDALYYDNVGNRRGVEQLQWAWETRFLNVGATWTLNEHTRLQAQAMNGETLMGFARGTNGYWIDVGFTSAYLLASRGFGDDALTGRLDWFSMRDRTYKLVDDNAEEGWAATLAWRHAISPKTDFLIEATHVSSDRPARVYGGLAPEQSQTALQTSLRLGF